MSRDAHHDHVHGGTRTQSSGSKDRGERASQAGNLTDGGAWVRARRAYQNWPWNTFNPTRHARDGGSLRCGDVAHTRSPGMGIARFGFRPGERSPGTWQCSRPDCSRSSRSERYAGRWCDQIRNSLATSHKGLRSPAGCTGRPAKCWLRDYEARSREACECDGCDKVA